MKTLSELSAEFGYSPEAIANVLRQEGLIPFSYQPDGNHIYHDSARAFLASLGLSAVTITQSRRPRPETPPEKQTNFTARAFMVPDEHQQLLRESRPELFGEDEQ